MRKYVWMALAAVACLTVGGLVYAHTALSPAPVQTSIASSSPGDENPCPLSWLFNKCCLGR